MKLTHTATINFPKEAMLAFKHSNASNYQALADGRRLDLSRDESKLQGKKVNCAFLPRENRWYVEVMRPVPAEWLKDIKENELISPNEVVAGIRLKDIPNEVDSVVIRTRKYGSGVEEIFYLGGLNGNDFDTFSNGPYTREEMADEINRCYRAGGKVIFPKD